MARALLCLVGVLVCVYSIYVEHKAVEEPGFKAACDIDDHISCSRVFTSEYGRGLGLVHQTLGKESILHLPNSVFGLAFYAISFVLSLVRRPVTDELMLAASVISMVTSAYLAYVLAVILKDICIVCISTYFINGALLVLNYRAVSRNRSLSATAKPKRS
eukprot:m.81941 g.81941  ORF g.81941 m.81941 type:complete len:160 (-) comp8094_c1_seq1:550-1029(-)